MLFFALNNKSVLTCIHYNIIWVKYNLNIEYLQIGQHKTFILIYANLTLIKQGNVINGEISSVF